MTAKTSIFYDIITQYNDKGAKAAEKSFLNLGELGKKLTGALSLGALTAFAGKAISMAAAEDKQFKILDTTLQNLGLGFAAENSNKMIDSMALATGVAKSELIPAYQQLLTATGDVQLSQKDLQLALDVSAGTGKDLATVTTAISKGYLGNTVALTRLGAGLDKTLLKTGDMTKITAKLTDVFGNDASVAADTFQGKINRVKLAADQATVSIGEGLIGAIDNLSGKGKIDGLVTGITNFGDEIKNVILGIGDLVKAIEQLPEFKRAGAVGSKVFSFATLFPIASFFSNVHKSTVADANKFLATSPDIMESIRNRDAQAKVLANKKKELEANKAILAAQKAQTLEQQKQATLKLIGTQSDQIAMAEIYAAKQKNISAEDALQLDLQLKLLEATNSTGAAGLKAADDALILQEKILMANGLIKLADGSIVNLSEAKNPFAGFDKYVADALAQIAKVQAAVAATTPSAGLNVGTAQQFYNGTSGGLYGSTPVNPGPSSIMDSTNPYSWFAGSPAYDPMNGNANINVTVGIDPNSGNLYSMVQNANYSNTANGNAATINRNNGLSGGYG